MSAAKGPSKFVDAAYHLDDEADMVNFYRKWAADYDHQMLDELGYTSQTRIAQQLGEYLPDTASTVFDIGCGTGLSCVFLAEMGYTNLDGIDLSPDMVRVAKRYCVDRFEATLLDARSGERISPYYAPSKKLALLPAKCSSSR